MAISRSSKLGLVPEGNRQQSRLSTLDSTPTLNLSRSLSQGYRMNNLGTCVYQKLSKNRKGKTLRETLSMEIDETF